MFKNSVQKVVKDGRIKWQRHALQRMLERDIARDEVKQVLLTDELIEHYPDDYSIESGLFLGYTENKTPLHVVAGMVSDT